MKSTTRLGTFEDVIAQADPVVANICLALRETIRTLHPDCVEVARLGESSVSYGYGEKKMSEAYAYIMPQRGYTNLGFYHGTSLAGHEEMLAGTGKKLRHVKIRTAAEAQSEAIQNILRTAVQERAEALGLGGS